MSTTSLPIRPRRRAGHAAWTTAEITESVVEALAEDEGFSDLTSLTWRSSKLTFQDRTNVDDITSISSFVEFVAYFLSIDLLEDFSGLDQVLRSLAEGRSIRFENIGQGLSFKVHTRSRPTLSKPLSTWMPDGEKIVAIKVPILAGDRHVVPGECFRSLAFEIHVLCHVPIRSSNNVVKLLGLLWEERQSNENTSILLPALVLEFANEGSLDALIDSDEYSLAYWFKKKLVVDVAFGLSALHRCGIIHGDVKASNVLLFSTDGQFMAKVADFGCSVQDFDTSATVEPRGRSRPWDAPEISKGRVGSSLLVLTDIYSWGLLVWRVMLNARTPFDLNANVRLLMKGFESIQERDDKDGKLVAAQNLKDNPNDVFLQAVLDNLDGFGLMRDDLSHIFSQTLRVNPKDRTRDIESIAQGLGINSQQNTTKVDRPATEPRETAPTSFTSFVDARSTDLGAINRTFASTNLLQKSVGITVVPGAFTKLPLVAKVHMTQDYIRLAEDEKLPKETRACAALKSAINILAGFLENVGTETALSMIKQAAELDNIEAQAIVYRLHLILDKTLISNVDVKLMLAGATGLGSRIAAEDLSSLDPRLAKACLATYAELLHSRTVRGIGMSIHKARKNGAALDCDMLLSQVQSTGRLDECLEGLHINLLQFAVFQGRDEIVDRLLKSGADVNCENELNLTALNIACARGRSKLAHKLLDAGADPSLADLLGVSPLHRLVFVEASDVGELCQKLIASGADVNQVAVGIKLAGEFLYERFRHQGTPLHWAVAYGHTDLASILLKLGADAQKSDGMLELANRVLPAIVHGLDGDQTVTDSSSPLLLAAQNLNFRMLIMMLEHLKNQRVVVKAQPLIAAILHSDKVHLLIKHGQRWPEKVLGTIMKIRTMYPEPEDDNPLFLAIMNDSFPLVKHIMETGESPNWTKNDATNVYAAQMPMLDLSLMRRDGDITLLLLESGADPHQRGSLNCSSLSLAALRPQGTRTPEIVRALIARGVTFETTPESFRILYRRAVVEGWKDLTGLLASSGVPRTDPDMDPDLLAELLKQNSYRALAGLNCLLESRHLYEKAIPTYPQASNANVFHSIVSVTEYIRDDDLNSRIVEFLLHVFPQKDIFDAPGGPRNLTPLAVAVACGNHLAAEILLDAGADVWHVSVGREGKYGPPMTWLLMNRLTRQPEFGGRFEGLSSRTRMRKLHRQNSEKLLIIFLNHEIKEASRSWTLTDQDRLQPLLLSWLAQEYWRSSMQRKLSRMCTNDEPLEVVIDSMYNLSCRRRDTLAPIDLSDDDLVEVWKGYWYQMVAEWRTASIPKS